MFSLLLDAVEWVGDNLFTNKQVDVFVGKAFLPLVVQVVS